MTIVTSQELLYETLRFDAFQVAEIDGKIGSVLRLEEFDHLFFLSSLGTAPQFEGQGLASGLIRSLQAQCSKPIYLYTIIPGFFARLGFLPVDPPTAIPPRSLFACENCHIQRCACMVYQPPGVHRP